MTFITSLIVWRYLQNSSLQLLQEVLLQTQLWLKLLAYPGEECCHRCCLPSRGQPDVKTQILWTFSRDKSLLNRPMIVIFSLCSNDSRIEIILHYKEVLLLIWNYDFAWKWLLRWKMDSGITNPNAYFKSVSVPNHERRDKKICQQWGNNLRYQFGSARQFFHHNQNKTGLNDPFIFFVNQNHCAKNVGVEGILP